MLKFQYVNPNHMLTNKCYKYRAGAYCNDSPKDSFTNIPSEACYGFPLSSMATTLNFECS